MSATIRFELRLEVQLPVDAGDDPRDYITPGEQRRLERDILKQLKYRLAGEVVDIEVLETNILKADGNPREKGDDDGREYGDPRDERDERRR